MVEPAVEDVSENDSARASSIADDEPLAGCMYYGGEGIICKKLRYRRWTARRAPVEIFSTAAQVYETSHLKDLQSE